jgi:hypothetical protein
MVEATRNMYFGGNKVIIWTARQWSEAPQIVGWLRVHEVPFHGLQCAKGGADKYIDDKTVTPEEFLGEETVMRVNSPETTTD